MARFDPGGAALIVGTTADADILAFGPRGAVQAGFPVEIAPGTARSPAAPAGSTAAVALGGEGKDSAIWASDARELLVRLNPDGSRRTQLRLDGPPGSAGLQDDGAVWVATPSSLYRFDQNQGQPAASWPQPLGQISRPRGLFVGWTPAPVLTMVNAQPMAWAAAWGGPLTRFDASGHAEVFSALAWSTSLAVADIDLDGQPDLLAATGPTAEIMGLGPAQASLAGPSAFRSSGEDFEGFGIRAGTAPFAPLVVDLGGDRAPEVVFGDDQGRIWAIRADGNVARGFPKVCGDPLFGAPAVADLDGDGRLELVAVTRRGRVWAWRLDAPASASAPWPGARGGPRSLGTPDLEGTAPTDRSAESCRCVLAYSPDFLTGLIFLLVLWPVSLRWVCANNRCG